MKKMTPERFNLICDTLYGMVRRVQDMTDEKVSFDVSKHNSKVLGEFLMVTIWIRSDDGNANYDICSIIEDAEEMFERAKEHLNDILSKASVQFEEIEEVEEE